MQVGDLPEIEKLSTEEKILLVEDLWDSIATDDDRVSIPESHMAELDARYRKYLVGPNDTLTLRN